MPNGTGDHNGEGSKCGMPEVAPATRYWTVCISHLLARTPRIAHKLKLEWHAWLHDCNNTSCVARALTQTMPNRNQKRNLLDQQMIIAVDLNYLQNLQYWADPVSFLYPGRWVSDLYNTEHSYRPASIRVQLLMFNGSHH